MKRTVWILLAAIAVVAGVYIAADLLGNGMLREFLSEQFFYMEEYTDTTGILHQYLSPNWYRIKQLFFFADGTGCCNLYCLRADTKQPCRYEAQGRDRKGDGNGPASVFGGSRFLSSGGLW